MGGLLALLLLGSALLVLAPAPPSPPTGRVTEPVRTMPEDSAGVAVTPSRWTMVAGASVELRAYLVTATSGCIPQQAAFSWQLEGYSTLLGYLNATTGSYELFRSFAYVTGTAEIQVSAVGVEFCDLLPQTFETNLTAQITEVPPLYVSGISGSPDPALPYTPVALAATFTGGLGPYNITLDFGDGTSEPISDLAPSAIRVTHAYPVGQFLPSVRVTDALGETETGPATDPLLVSSALAVAAYPASNEFEQGVPTLLSASATGGQAPYTFLWNASTGATHLGATWVVDPAEPGSETVTVQVRDAEGTATSSSLRFEVAPSIAVAVQASRPQLDLGQPLWLNLSIEGGVPPYQISGSADPSGSRFDLAPVTTSDLEEVIVPDAPGLLWAQVTATDALGSLSTVTVPVATVSALPDLLLSASPSVLEVGQPVSLIGIASGGGPFNWSMATTGGFSSAQPLTPTLDTVGLFAWTGRALAPGPVLVAVSAEDAAGGTATRNLTLEVRPAVAITLRTFVPAPTAGEPLALGIDVTGGFPPYAVLLQPPEGNALPSNRAGPGPFSVNWTPSRSGDISLQASVIDGAGAAASSNLSLVVSAAPGSAPVAPPPPAATNRTPGPSAPAPGPRPSSGGDPWTGFGSGLGTGVLLAAVLAVLLVRMRRRAAPPAAPDRSAAAGPAALAATRRLLSESDGLDSEMVYLLTDEEGIDREATAAALRRWISLGRVRSVPGESDGSPRYVWVSGPPPGGPDPAVPEEGA